MTGESDQVFSSLMLSLAGGAVLYVVDRYAGVPLYRWAYNLTHQHPLSSDTRVGFIYNRRAHHRFATASSLALVQAAMSIIRGAASPALEAVLFFVRAPLIMTGFYLGPLLFRFWENRGKMLDRVDQLEDGEIKIKEKIKKASVRANEVVKQAVESVVPESKSPLEEAQKNVVSASKEEVVEDPRELMQSYLRKGSDE